MQGASQAKATQADPMLPYDDYYELLGVSPTASAAEITQAFRSLAKAHHPDRNIAQPDRVQAESFAYITAAYETLRDPKKRRDYDQQLRTQLAIAKSPAQRTGAFWGGVVAGLSISLIFIALVLFPSAMPWKSKEGKFQESLAYKNSTQKVSPSIVIDVAAKSSPPTSSSGDGSINSTDWKTGGNTKSQSVSSEGSKVAKADETPSSQKPEESPKPAALAEPKQPAPAERPKAAARADELKSPVSATEASPNNFKSQEKSAAALSDAAVSTVPQSRFADEVSGLEATIERGADGSAAYRLISMIASSTREDDLKRAAAVAKNKQTVELIQKRLDQISAQDKQPGEAWRGRLPQSLIQRPAADCASCPQLVEVKEGTFVMGVKPGEPGARPEEFPARRVTIARPFLVSKSKIDLESWRLCRLDGGCQTLGLRAFATRPNSPATRLTWNDTQDYIRWLSRKTGKRYRLLSEAEWEYISRQKVRDGRQDAFVMARDGAPMGPFANIFRTLKPRPVVDGSSVSSDPEGFSAGPAEWTADCWHGNYAGAPNDGSAWLGDHGGVCAERVIRGGSLGGFAETARLTARAPEAIQSRSPFVGFHVARDADPYPSSIEAENK